jgi:hypothetical protein
LKRGKSKHHFVPSRQLLCAGTFGLVSASALQNTTADQGRAVRCANTVDEVMQPRPGLVWDEVPSDRGGNTKARTLCEGVHLRPPRHEAWPISRVGEIHTSISSLDANPETNLPGDQQSKMGSPRLVLEEYPVLGKRATHRGLISAVTIFCTSPNAARDMRQSTLTPGRVGDLVCFMQRSSHIPLTDVTRTYDSSPESGGSPPLCPVPTHLSYQ